MAAFKGEAYVTANALLGDRFFKFSTDNTDAGPADRTWELNAGASIPLYFREWTTGAAPPATPDGDGTDIVEMTVYYETGTGTLVKTVYTGGTSPAVGLIDTFYATSDGTVGGSPRAGTLRLRLRVIQSNELLDNYNLDSDADTASQRPGALRCNMLVSDLVDGGYPSGTTYAYGVAGDETITLTATHTQRFADRNVETIRIDSLDGTGTQSSGSSKEIGTTSTAQTFTANNTFDNSLKSYGMRLTVTGNSLLLPAESWTLPVDNGVNVTQNGSTSVQRTSFYNVDPRISIQNVTLSQALHNRGEATTIDFNVQNARAQNLTRSISYQLKNSAGTTRSSGSDAGANYDINYTLTASDDASFDFTGNQWTFNTNQADVTSNPSSNAYLVSRKMRLGSAAGSNDLAVVTDQEVYNRGESPAISYYLSYADGRALASRSVNTRVHDNGGTSNEEDVQVKSTTAGGLISYSYLIGASDKAAFDAIGSPKHIEADWSGNTTDDSAGEWGVSNKLIVPGYIDADNAGDFWSGKTDLDATNDYDPDGTDETDYFVGADVAYTKIRVQNIRGEDYDSAAVTIWLLRNAAIAQGPQTGSVTDSSKDGWMDLFYQFDVKAPAGARVFRAEAVRDGNTTGNDTFGNYLTKNVNYAPSYTGNLYAELVYESQDSIGDTTRFTLTPIIYATNNDRQLLSAVSPVPTVDIDPRYHYTVYDAAVPIYSGSQVTMTRINIGDDDHFEATVSGLSAYDGKTVWIHVVFTLNGGQLQAGFPVKVGAGSAGTVQSAFDGIDFATGFPYR